jgi:parvulin-like peptidyl-prolyl isomerase
VESGYGVHLVLVRERTERRLPQLAEVRETVRREWFAGRRREANEAFYRYLREKYTVIVEEPEWADKVPRRQAEVR